MAKYNTSMFLVQLPTELQIEISHIVQESIVDMCLTHEEGEEAYDNALCGRICDLSELLRYGEVLALLHLDGVQVFGEVEIPVKYDGEFPVVDFNDWLIANDYDTEEDTDVLINNFLDFCNDWSLEQYEF